MEPLFVDRLLQITDLFQKDMARAFAGTGLTPTRVHLLWVLQHAGPSTQQTLATLCEVTPRNITGLVDALEKSGHVRRTPHPTDRRAVLVELTPMAVETMTRMQDDHAQLNATLLGAIDPDDRAAVERGLSSVAAHLEKLAPPRLPQRQRPHHDRSDRHVPPDAHGRPHTHKPPHPHNRPHAHG